LVLLQFKEDSGSRRAQQHEPIRLSACFTY